MFLFYTPPNNEGKLVLIDDEMRHAVKTLRKREGDEIMSTDGLGTKYISRIESITRSHVTLHKTSEERVDKGKNNLHIAIAITKKPNRFEWFLEKATEIGIDRITPLTTTRTEKKNINLQRSKKILVSAMKQSQRYYLPQLDELCSFSDYLDEHGTNNGQKLIANYSPENPQLKDTLKSGTDLTILIGPEGDFTERELSLVEAAGYHSINLGNFRLRTETAGVVACHTFNLLNIG